MSTTMPSKDTITLQKSSLYRLGYTVPLCFLFLYFSKTMILAPPVLWIPGATVTENLQINFDGDEGKVYLSGFSDFSKLELDSLNLDFCRFQQNDDRNGCLEELNNQKIKISNDESGEDGVVCHKVRREGLRCINQMIRDCYKLGTSHWYGGFEALSQFWPLKKAIMDEDGVIVTNDPSQPKSGVELKMGPYIGGDYGMHRTNLLNVLDRLFISSSGVGLFVSKESPLHVSFNQHGDGKICLAAMYDAIHYFSQHGKPPVLEYTVCKARDVKTIYKYMTGRFIPKPPTIPHPDLFTRPIWSTWAQYNKDINQTAILDFANKIVSNNLPISQLEIDDKWMTEYGDLTFDTIKFPDVHSMIEKLSSRGLPVTLWVHPFISLNSHAFQDAVKNKYLIMNQGSSVPALVRWWNEDMAGLLDVTNPAAVLWFQKRLWKLKEDLNITSFKFDAGEGLFLPHGHSTYRHISTTNEYMTLWSELAHGFDTQGLRQEVRVGWNSQHVPIFVRLLDKLSIWGPDGGLQSLIPSVLTLGLIGYPFVLPDMIGGNAYADTDMDTFTGGAYPDRELYVRWLQASLFMPALQFSIVPWQYDDEVVKITQDLLKQREEYASTFVTLAEESVRTGDPIVRPLWWIAAQDDDALVVDDEFLLGDNLLVAPVVVEGARKRDIYIPFGTWEDKLRGTRIQGPTWLKDYAVPLHELPFFQRSEL